MQLVGMGSFRTPHGRDVTVAIRPDTSDWNTANAILTGDEYGIPTGLTGWAVDVGAHLGAWTIGVALDNPDLRVLAIDALPENAELARRNVTANGLDDRVQVLQRAASCIVGTEAVRYGFEAARPDAAVHRFIGDQRNVRPDEEQVEVQTVTLDEVVALTSDIALLKIDCEGCEFRFLDSQAIDRVERIVGEYHGPIADLRALLESTHEVTHSGEDGFGAFTAVRKAAAQ